MSTKPEAENTPAVDCPDDAPVVENPGPVPPSKEQPGKHRKLKSRATLALRVAMRVAPTALRMWSHGHVDPLSIHDVAADVMTLVREAIAELDEAEAAVEEIADSVEQDVEQAAKEILSKLEEI